eukprot:NODE_2163_length_1666_cov_18.782242_g1851_i0.p1 GENE.NODE_2163_length_1666_cov_18.782242_g1851_i0~~NODE_2163_length_1666_cov_18.782242_g1851_i0.p1  ORF type:complete len:330 (+),score=63.06 NODE_2163_length_1666_cov_18.782242_g1851_i0:56-991(+)
MTSLTKLDFSKELNLNNQLYELHTTQISYEHLRTALAAFAKYVPISVVEGLLSGSIRDVLEMEMSKICILFMDLENFTKICESVPVSTLIQCLSQIFEDMTQIILKNNGTLDKYIGDCIMAFWGAPKSLIDSSSDTFNAIQQMQKLNNSLSCLEGFKIRFRTGVHKGKALVGNFGSSKRLDFTALGNTVNLAARLEPLNKQFKTYVLSSEDFYNSISYEDQNFCRFIGKTQIIGRSSPIKIYQILDKPLNEFLKGSWEAAMSYFSQGDYKKAEKIFESLTDDEASVELARECNEKFKTPYSGVGIRTMLSK